VDQLQVKLHQVGEMALLRSGQGGQHAENCGRERLVVRLQHEVAALQQETVVADRCEGGQQLPVESGVFELGWRQLAGEKGQGLVAGRHQLLKDRPDVGGGRVDGQKQGGAGYRVAEWHGCRQGSFGGQEGGLHGRQPGQGLRRAGQRVGERLEHAGDTGQETAVKIN
jgi:hypothetical protein